MTIYFNLEKQELSFFIKKKKTVMIVWMILKLKFCGESKSFVLSPVYDTCQ